MSDDPSVTSQRLMLDMARGTAERLRSDLEHVTAECDNLSRIHDQMWELIAEQTNQIEHLRSERDALAIEAQPQANNTYIEIIGAEGALVAVYGPFYRQVALWAIDSDRLDGFADVAEDIVAVARPDGYYPAEVYVNGPFSLLSPI